MSNISVTAKTDITLVIQGTQFVLTLDEAKALNKELSKALGSETLNAQFERLIRETKEKVREDYSWPSPLPSMPRPLKPYEVPDWRRDNVHCSTNDSTTQ